MTPAQRNDIPSLQNRQSRFYGNWLSGGLKAYLLQGLGRDAFPGAANYVGWMSRIDEDLASIYAALNAIEQSEFRLGIQIAIAETDVSDLPVQEALLHLSTLIGAPEVLEIVPSLASTAKFESAAAGNRFFRLLFDVTVELATPTPKALEALHAIITSSGFRPAVAPAALIALCRASPLKFPQHLNQLATLNKFFSRPRRASGWDFELAGELVVALRDIIPISAMSEAYNPLQRSGWVRSDAPLRDWFFATLTYSRDPEVEDIFKNIKEYVAANHRSSRKVTNDYEIAPISIVASQSALESWESALG